MDYVLGIACNGTDSAACLFENAELLCAVEEERFTRVRHDGCFPRHSVRWCMEFAGIDPDDICKVAIAWDYSRYGLANGKGASIRDFYRSLEHKGHPIEWEAVELHIEKFQPKKIVNTLRDEFSGWSLPPIHYYCHHDCHAASSYCFSGFERSLVLVLDEKGEDICTSVYLGKGDCLHLLERHKVPHSLGLYYAAATQFLGFAPFCDEGTFMALASHGKRHPILWSWLSENVLKNTPNGIVLNPSMVSKKVFNYPRSDFFYTDRMIRELAKFGIQHPLGAEEILPIHQDFARTIQEVLECVVREFIAANSKMIQVDRLCIAGGVGLNCTLNGRIIESSSQKGEFRELFLPPWCHDAGGAIGAAVLALSEGDGVGLKLPRFDRLHRADWGPNYPDTTTESLLQDKRLSYFRSPNVAREAAELLACGKIIAWFQGRAEFGPRALGQRGLLSHPRLASNRQRLQDIKQRLPFRPFAPSVLEEYAFQYFSTSRANADFMTTAFRATDLAHQEIPNALNAADGTVRPQIVRRRKGWPYRELIEEFYRLTGIPAILNTSFNIKEPMVLTPDDAVSTFLRSNIDLLIVGNFIVKHPLT